MEKYDWIAVADIDVADLAVQNLYATARQMVGAFRLRCRCDWLGECDPDATQASNRQGAGHYFWKGAARDVQAAGATLPRLLLTAGNSCAICHLLPRGAETSCVASMPRWVCISNWDREENKRSRALSLRRVGAEANK